MNTLRLVFASLVVLLAACSAKPVRCDQHLVPINPPAKVNAPVQKRP